MLKQIGRDFDPEGAIVSVADANYPLPFARELEFNAPAHGNWNIVHIGMLIPEAHEIYVGSDNCMRGVVMTAAEMNALDRYSTVILEEDDLLDGNLEDVTIEGVADVIRKLPYRPRCVQVFLVCLHHFLGSDTERIYGELEAMFPDIDFARCWMDPIMQKTGLTPEQKDRKAILDPVRPLPVNPRSVNVIGGDLPMREENDIARVLKAGGFTVRQLPTNRTYDEFLAMGESFLNLCYYPSGDYAVRMMNKRLGRDYLYLPSDYDDEAIVRYLKELTGRLNMNEIDPSPWMEERDRALQKARSAVGEMPVTIDYMSTPRPLSLARALRKNGFQVQRVYLDAITPEEEGDLLWLQKNAPELELASTMNVKMRVMPRGTEPVLAIGPKAAWFGGTGHFVNMIENGGSWGFGSLTFIAEEMVRAVKEEKDTRDLVPRKGLGCASCI
ncbi:MAG: nitrogenase [Oscillospiraceae bacterium]|nr:nitrogenase [Oscillospiraceae bacterium]